jgi:hypothetical protein
MWWLGSCQWLWAAALLGYKAAPRLRAYMWALSACSRAHGHGHTGTAAVAQWTLRRVLNMAPNREAALKAEPPMGGLGCDS